MIAKRKRAESRYVVCLKNKGYEASLERNKIYRAVSDPAAESEGDLRVVDESGEDYLYPQAWFVTIEVPAKVEASVRGRTRDLSNTPLQPPDSARG